MAARRRICCDELVEIARGRTVRSGEGVRNNLCDAEERQPSLEKGCDRDLVRRVENARIGPSQLARTARMREQRERLDIGRVELEHHAGPEIERGNRRRGTLGIGERIRDGDAHVRIAEVRERRAVAETEERVHDRARVHHHFDLLVRQLEEEVRLDQLETLVGERRRVDGDLRAHAPRRMRQRFRWSHVVELVTRPASEGASGGGEHERMHLVDTPALEALERGRVLAVDRNQPSAAPPPGLERELAGGDQALLVREREIDAVLQRPERRRQPGEADDGIEDEVGLGALEELCQIAPDLGQRREAVDRPGARGGSTELQLRVGADDLQRLAPDRARSAQESDSLHRGSVGSAAAHAASNACLFYDAATTENSSESTRSRTPPCAARSRPVSFTCMSRFSADSNRSPTGPTTAMTTPRMSASPIDRKWLRS